MARGGARVSHLSPVLSWALTAASTLNSSNPKLLRRQISASLSRRSGSTSADGPVIPAALCVSEEQGPQEQGAMATGLNTVSHGDNTKFREAKSHRTLLERSLGSGEGRVWESDCTWLWGFFWG